MIEHGLKIGSGWAKKHVKEDSEASRGVVARAQGEQLPPPLNFGLSKNNRKIFLSENFRPKMQKLGLKTLILKQIGAKLKF